MKTGERSFKITYFQLDSRWTGWKVAFSVFKSPLFGHKDWCVYTGIRTPQHLCSSINAAEEIIAGILKEEKLNCDRVRFFDLQTHSFYRKDSGEFEFEEVLGYVPGQRSQSLTWRPCACPAIIREVFYQFIGNDIPRTPRQKVIDRLDAARAKINWPKK